MRTSILIISVLEFMIACGIAAIMALAGVAKLLDPRIAMEFLKTTYGIPAVWGERIVYSLGTLELMFAILLLLGIGRWRWPATITLLLVGFFIGIMVDVHLRNPFVGIDCGCFGKLQSPVGGESLLSHIRLNLALAGGLVLQMFARTHLQKTSHVNSLGRLADNEASTERAQSA